MSVVFLFYFILFCRVLSASVAQRGCWEHGTVRRRWHGTSYRSQLLLSSQLIPSRQSAMREGSIFYVKPHKKRDEAIRVVVFGIFLLVYLLSGGSEANGGEIWLPCFSRAAAPTSRRGDLLQIISLGMLNLCLKISLAGDALCFLIVIFIRKFYWKLLLAAIMLIFGEKNVLSSVITQVVSKCWRVLRGELG